MSKPVPKGWECVDVAVRGAFAADDSICKRTVAGYVSPDVPGLAITPTQGGIAEWGEWTVTHTPSGYRVASPMRNLKAAARLALRLAKLTDWTRTEEDIRADKALHAAVQKFYKLHLAAPTAPETET